MARRGEGTEPRKANSPPPPASPPPLPPLALSPEIPYALLIASLLRLTTSDYDELRRKAGAYVTTMFNVFPWLRRPAAVSVLARLERLADRARAVDAAARAPTVRAAGGGAPALASGAVALAPYAETAAELAAAATPLRHALVFGLAGVLFAVGASASDLFLLDKQMRLLLRVPALVAALPVEKHAEATAVFGGGVAALMGRWHALAAPVAPARAARWISTRDALIAHLLTAMNPFALGGGGAPGGGGAGLCLSSAGAYERCAAPLPPSPLHWRYELVAGGFLGVLTPPALPAGAPLACAAPALGTGAPPAAPPPPPPHLIDAAWLWALTNALSDSTLLRMQAFATLGGLLHARAGAPAAGRPPLPAPTALLAAPAFASQFVAAVSKNHRRSGEADPTSAGAGFRELAYTHEGVRSVLDYAASEPRWGQSSSMHAELFELLGELFPGAVPALLAALAAVGGEGEEGAGDAPAAPAGGGEEKKDAPAPAQELATLQTRQATVAEAWGGLLRVVIRARAYAPALAGAFPADESLPGALAWCAGDARAPRAAAGVPAWPPTTPAASAAAFSALLALAAPILEKTPADWKEDWGGPLRYALRGMHPLHAAPLLRFVFANAEAALHASGGGGGGGFMGDAVVAAQEAALAALHCGGGAPPAPPPPPPPPAPAAAAAPAAPASAASFTAATRWLYLMRCAFTELASVPAGGAAVSATAPGVHFAEDAAAEVRRAWGADAALPVLPPRAPPRAALAVAARGILPALTRAAAHSYKQVRRDAMAAFFVALEATWAPVEVEEGASAAPAAAAHAGGRFERPQALGWLSWAPRALAALMLPLPAAAAVVRAEGGKGAADRSPTGNAAENALVGPLYLAFAAADAPVPLATPLALALLPAVLAAHGLPDKENSRLAEAVAAPAVHSLTLCAPEGGALGMPFLGETEAVLSALLASAGLGGSGAGERAASPAAALTAVLGAFAAESGGGGGGGGGVLARALLHSPPPAPPEGPSWLVRRAALKAVTAVRGYHFLALSRREVGALQRLPAVAVLGDSQPEVAEGAAEALVGFHLAAPFAARAASARALHAALAAPAAKPPARVPPPVAAPGTPAHAAEAAAHKAFKAAAAEATRARLGVALAASALLRAQPFDVPPFLPPVIALLLRLANAQKPVGVAAQKAVAEFRHLHQDLWQQHKLAFSEELAAEIMQVGSGTTYFA